MQQNESDIIILKPTKSFLSFLAEQQPDIEIPEISAFKSNHTAYTIIKRDSDEATLDEVERNFPAMFRHEICRLFGESACNHFEGSFIDFLMCFKFELHNHIVLMEPSIEQGNQLLCVKPRSVVLKLIKPEVNQGSNNSPIGFFKSMNLAHIMENATVLVKNFNKLSEIKPFIQSYYRPIFKAEMLRMHSDVDQWPVIDTFQMFRRYFEVEIHTQLIHLNATSPTLRDARRRHANINTNTAAKDVCLRAASNS
jgi:hypothetical protein